MHNTTDNVPRDGEGGKQFKYKPSHLQKLAQKLHEKRKTKHLSARLGDLIEFEQKKSGPRYGEIAKDAAIGGVTSAVGTAGLLAGVGAILKRKAPDLSHMLGTAAGQHIKVFNPFHTVPMMHSLPEASRLFGKELKATKAVEELATKGTTPSIEEAMKAYHGSGIDATKDVADISAFKKKWNRTPGETMEKSVGLLSGMAATGVGAGGGAVLSKGWQQKNRNESSNLSALLTNLIQFRAPIEEVPEIDSWNPFERRRQHQALQEYVDTRPPSAGITAEDLEREHYPEVKRGFVERFKHGYKNAKEHQEAWERLGPMLTGEDTVPVKSLKSPVPTASSYGEVTGELKKQGVGFIPRHGTAILTRPLVWSGHNAAFAPRGEKGLIITPKKVHPLAFRHEAGHARDYAHYGGEQAWKKVYPYYGNEMRPRKDIISSTMLPEHRAWAYAKPRSKKDKQLRDDALTTYRTAMGLSAILDDLIQFGRGDVFARRYPKLAPLPGDKLSESVLTKNAELFKSVRPEGDLTKERNQISDYIRYRRKTVGHIDPTWSTGSSIR
jgi:hypothetical protein